MASSTVVENNKHWNANLLVVVWIYTRSDDVVHIPSYLHDAEEL
jgi:hypothetical protein